MTFTLDAQVAAVLAAAIEQSGPPPAPPVGDVAGRRVVLDAMLEYFNNKAQLIARDVDISDHRVVTQDGATLLARWYRRPSGASGAAALYLHGGGMIVGSVPIFDGPVSGRARRSRVSCSSTRCSTTARRRPTRTSRRSPAGLMTTGTAQCSIGWPMRERPVPHP